jgi:hypothetical protein
MEHIDALEFIERAQACLEHLVVEAYDLRVAVDAHERSIDAARSNVLWAIDTLNRERLREQIENA